MATTTPNFGWDIPQSTDLVKDGATAIAALGTDIDTALVDLKGGTTGQVLSKNSNTDLDFTWVAQDDSNAIQNAIVDAKGDLISATAADTPARLASSAVNGDVLTVDTSTATGLKWAAPSSGGITLISNTVASANSSLTLGSIPSTYKNLILVWHGLYTSDNSAFFLRFNNDSNTNYNIAYYYSGSNTINFNQGSNVNSGDNFGAIARNFTGGSTRYWEQYQGQLIIYNYASTSLFKEFFFETAGYNSGGASQGFQAKGTYSDTTAISSLDIYRGSGTGTFTNATNTSIRLYGVS